MNEVVRRVEAVFATKTPVGFYLERLRGENRHILAQESRRDIGLERRRRHVADKDKDDSFGFLDRIGLDAYLPCHRAARIVEDAAEFSIVEIVGEGMIPARKGVIGIEQRALGEAHAPMGAPIFDSVEPAGSPDEQDLLAQELHRTAPAFSQVTI